MFNDISRIHFVKKIYLVKLDTLKGLVYVNKNLIFRLLILLTFFIISDGHITLFVLFQRKSTLAMVVYHIQLHEYLLNFRVVNIIDYNLVYHALLERILLVLLFSNKTKFAN